ncbi:uncharacterized protein [Rutidosis leptorrhynchoides]|uniref:uncharacterized protein n=1 Tax=Rutidosis leptorrhynchoides TaxID=125765 RepID=UPI003A9A518B
MTMMQMGCSSFDQENKIGTMGYDQHHEDDDSFSSDVSSVVSSDDESSDDVFEEESSSSNNNSISRTNENILGDMSDLLQQLPSKKGLSKHFQGKSQSFTSLSKVLCLEDLAKPENPYNKKLKSCKSYVALSRMLPPPTRSASSSKLFNKNRASCSSSSIGRNGSYLGLNNSNRPPTHPSHQTNSATNGSGFSSQTPLFV